MPAKKKAKPSKAMGKRIKAARVEKDLTQAQLAEKAGIDNTVLCRYELAQRRPSSQHIKSLAKALRVSQEFLRTGK